ncbi:MAG: hypothetical protein HY698_01955 [Deltaproteobacteria bacterium]|nr:hypothetical protein [Deltaproteobacteria bacterium]
MPRVLSAIRKKNLHSWLGGYARHLVTRALLREVPKPCHILVAFCDHFEPFWRGATSSEADNRVRTWEKEWPTLARAFRDWDGRHPRHSFFYPGEQYMPDFLERLGNLARTGLGEVEFHLHHDRDTARGLREDIGRYLAEYSKHGHLSRDASGRPRYAFIHGNWCLANSRKDGRWCGVDDEIPLLFETGCYADFTFPSAPDETQPNIVNQVYWPVGDLAKPRAYEQGQRARVGEIKRDRILIIQGPLCLIPPRAGRFTPKIENGHVTGRDPATPNRIRSWVAQWIHVEGRPEWVFVKIHTHGAPEQQATSLLGAPGRAFHAELTGRYNDGKNFCLHYVTAREMYNLAMAAMAGKSGNPADFLDFELSPPPVTK